MWRGPQRLCAVASCMTPDAALHPVRRASQGAARYVAGLALLLVTGACGSSADDVSQVESSSAPTPATTASPHSTEAFPQSTVTQSEAIRAGGIEGPYTLHIPRIDLNASVVPIQSNENRILEPPRNPSVAGWWSDGAAPGEPHGSAVVVGHTVRNNGGVFDHIGDLIRGDVIKVEGSNSTLTYRVQSIDVLPKDKVARNAEEIFEQTGAGRLVLITCDDWDGTTWRSNIVTIAAPV